MNYSKFCYQIHTLSMNRAQTVNKTRSILDEKIANLNTDTVGIFRKKDLDSFIDLNPNFKVSSENLEKPLKYPEVGLWASNYLAINAFLESDFEYLILVEDDVMLKNVFYTKLEEYLEEMPSDWDCFLIFKPTNIFYISGYESLLNEEQYYTDSLKIWKAHQSWSTGCLLLNRSGALAFKNYIESGISGAMDIFLFGSQKVMNVYSPAKLEESMAELHLYSTLIQSGKEIE